ncbi:MAG: carboxylate-amine ligase [Planctomycetota bacterium]|jgi:carboxylate-amine ligase
MNQQPFGMFEVWGIEIEYMIVDRTSLDVRSIADLVLRDASAGNDWVADISDGGIDWSNELVNHVIELKCAQPVVSLAGLASEFERSLKRLQQVLNKHDACLMPGGMHPWMVPATEARLWPHEGNEIYSAYDRMFDCKRHGWANLQSMHINLPFANASEFAQLMAAIRLVVPLVPALAASSPIYENRNGRRLDCRLAFYRGNSSKVPSMAGEIVPEAIFDMDEYRAAVLAPISRELRAHEAPPELLARDWLNARGAIARFDRMAIEIRVADAQENPYADLAIAAAVGTLVRNLVEQSGSSLAAQQSYANAPLVNLFKSTIRHGPEAELPPGYAQLFGGASSQTQSAGALCHRLLTNRFDGPVELEEPLRNILMTGTLAQRLRRSIGPDYDHRDIQTTYRRLCQCLAEGHSFQP